MKTGVEQSVYALVILNLLPEKAVLHSEKISRQLEVSPTYFQKLLRKLVNADLIASVAGVKGGFKLNRAPEDISVHDIFKAVEGQQPLYSKSGILDNMLELDKEERCCILGDLMEEAEDAWSSVLKEETIASLTEKIKTERFQNHVVDLKQWLDTKMVI